MNYVKISLNVSQSWQNIKGSIETTKKKEKKKSPERQMICKADVHPYDQPKGPLSVHFANYTICRR